jgi:Tfp pilus assembly protein PilV
MKNPSTRSSQRGFSIIEALIAGLVLSFGTLALVGVQITLSRNGEVSRQRTEATRLAQDKMEELRAFASINAITGIASYAGIVAGTDQPSTSQALNTTSYNTTFDREWTVTGTGADVHREVSVVVRWTDRHPELDPVTAQPIRQTVRLSSVISAANHAKVSLIMANAGSNDFAGIVRPRNNNVPYPAVDIGSNRSTYQWPGGTVWYVFDNSTADVKYRCTTQPTNGSDAALQANAACTAILAYVLAGYVSSASSNQAANIDAMLSGWLINACSLDNTSNVNGVLCFVENVIVPPNPLLPPPAPQLVINPNCPYLVSTTTPTTSQIDGLKFFKCYAALIEVPANWTGGWTGRLNFGTGPAPLTPPSGNQRICRYNHNVVAPGTVNGVTGAYSGVDDSLNNENYYAFRAANGNGPNSRCPTNATQHQP